MTYRETGFEGDNQDRTQPTNMRTTTKLTSHLPLAALLAGLAVQAQTVPEMINYQGRVTVGGIPVDGMAYLKFALVDSDGTTVNATYWSNDGTSAGGSEPTHAVGLTVSKGLYSVLLGDTGMSPILANVFSAHRNVRLRVWFSQAPEAPSYQLLAPDQRIAPVGYAMVAATVPDGAVSATALDPAIGVWYKSGSTISYLGGNVGIGTVDPQTKLDVEGSVQASGPIKASGGLILETRTSDPPSPVVGQIWLRTDL